MFTWAKLALVATQALVMFLTWLREKQLLNQGEALAYSKLLQEEVDLVNKAEAIRKKLDDDFARDGSSVMRHDKYERSDP